MSPDPESIPPELEQAFDERPDASAAMRGVWHALRDARPAAPVVPDRTDAWRDLEARLQSPSAVRTAPDRVPSRRRRRTLTFATGSLTLLLLALGIWWMRPVTIGVAPGEQRTVQLADGSRVDLNSATEIRLVRGFRAMPLLKPGERYVRLTGEAFFQVARDVDRPFVVETPDARVEVLGTAFNVRSRESGRGMQTLVTLQEGAIRVHARQSDASPVKMDSVGASLLVRAGSGPQHLERRSELDHLLAWRTQGFAAVDEPVGDILREVQRRYSVGLEIEPGLSMEDEMTVFYLRGTSAEQIIHDLCLSRGWRYRPTSDGFYVFSGQGISGTEGAQRKL